VRLDVSSVNKLLKIKNLLINIFNILSKILSDIMQCKLDKLNGTYEGF